MPIYTGIGSRSTPDDVLKQMEIIGEELAKAKWCLRSGYADGADNAFGRGMAKVPDAQAQIFLPWPGFNGAPDFPHPWFHHTYPEECEEQAVKYAAHVHPAWHNCSNAAKRLHTRNVYQILGLKLVEPSNMVICWTKDGKLAGGTATAIRLANMASIPVFNLANPGALDAACEYANRIQEGK